MDRVGIKPEEIKITFNHWCLVAVNCSASCQAGFGCSVLSCATTLLSKGVTAFHWGLVGKLFRDLP